MSCETTSKPTPWYYDPDKLAALHETYLQKGELDSREFKEITGVDVGDNGAMFVRLSGVLEEFQIGKQTDWRYRLHGGYQLTIVGNNGSNIGLRINREVGTEEVAVQPLLL